MSLPTPESVGLGGTREISGLTFQVVQDGQGNLAWDAVTTGMHGRRIEALENYLVGSIAEGLAKGYAAGDLRFTDFRVNTGTYLYGETVDINDMSAGIDLGNGQHEYAVAGGVFIYVTDSSRCSIRNGVILGSLADTPEAAIYFESIVGADDGTNENHIVENLIIGRRYGLDTTTGGSADTTPQFQFNKGVVIGGPVDGNNDEFTLRNLQIHSCVDVAVEFENTQSIWSQMENVLANDCTVGYRLGANMNITNPSFNRNSSYDIQLIRAVTARIRNLQSENSNECLRSDAGGSFQVEGGLVLRNATPAGNWVNFTSGGKLDLQGVEFNNVQNVFDRMRYRGGSLSNGIVRMRNITLPKFNRSTIDVDAGAFGAQPTEIDIVVKGFRLVTTEPYLDRELDLPALTAESATTLATGSSPVLLDSFYTVAFEGDLQDMHLSHVITSDANLRVHVFNSTAGTVDIGTGRFRCMGLADRVERKATRSVTPAFMADGTGQTINVPVKGARLGDFTTWSVSEGWSNVLITSYVSADNQVSLRIHNASGGGSLPATANLSLATVRGGKINSQEYIPITILNGANSQVTIPLEGVRRGHHVLVAYTEDLQGLIVTPNVVTDDSVTITLSNRTGGDVTLASGDFLVTDLNQ